MKERNTKYSPPLREGECTRLVHKFVLCVLCLFGATPFSSFAQAIYAENQIPARGVSIDYVLTIKNPMSHLYDVEIQIKGIRESSVSVSMPAWSPGIYRIENYARNVQDFRAVNARNQPLNWEQTDKQTWRIAKQTADDLNVHYQVFSTLLTDQMADVAPPSIFMYVAGQKHVPCSVKYNTPGGWKVYTGLERRGDRYYASDYDIFIDAPAFIGSEFKLLEFETGGARHHLVFSKPNISMSAAQVQRTFRTSWKRPWRFSESFHTKNTYFYSKFRHRPRIVSNI